MHTHTHTSTHTHIHIHTYTHTTTAGLIWDLSFCFEKISLKGFLHFAATPHVNYVWWEFFWDPFFFGTKNPEMVSIDHWNLQSTEISLPPRIMLKLKAEFLHMNPNWTKISSWLFTGKSFSILLNIGVGISVQIDIFNQEIEIGIWLHIRQIGNTRHPCVHTHIHIYTYIHIYVYIYTYV